MTKKQKIEADAITVRFAGDSGDGMQLTGDQFTDTTALMGNDFSTFPDFPAEIRAPVGTLPGVSSFQIQFSNSIIFTPGDESDVLIAMNPAALKVNIKNTKKGGLIIANTSAFTEMNLRKAAWPGNPLEDTTLKDFKVLKVALSELTKNALKEHPLKGTEVDRCKNFFALGMMFWLYDRDLTHTLNWIQKKFASKPEFAAANIAALKAGWNYADITETLPSQYIVTKSKLDPGTYRKVMGNEAMAIGFVTAAHLAERELFYASYPITPASDILHSLSDQKNFKVKTFQAEDEIAAMGAAIGASFGGAVAVTGTSGPGLCLKAEAINLAVMAELPVVIVDVQRAGPSTGMPTKTEQGDLLQSLFGRNGDSPLAILAPKTPADCFDIAIESVRLALKYMTPVIILSEGFLANSSEPWKLPDLAKLPNLKVPHPPAVEGKTFFPYERDPKTLSRPWATPGTPGLQHRIGGLSKADRSGNVSYDPDNHQKMIEFRAEKIQRIANDIPEVQIFGPKSGKALVLGWGGTYGTIYQVMHELEKSGKKVSHVHLNYVWPFPRNLGQILHQFETVLVPELNMGQLVVLLRSQFPDVKFVSIPKMKGQPFKILELDSKIREYL